VPLRNRGRKHWTRNILDGGLAPSWLGVEVHEEPLLGGNADFHRQAELLELRRHQWVVVGPGPSRQQTRNILGARGLHVLLEKRSDGRLHLAQRLTADVCQQERLIAMTPRQCRDVDQGPRGVLTQLRIDRSQRCVSIKETDQGAGARSV
jgi:hypothetical protein